MFWDWMHYFRVAKLRNVHSTTFDPKWYLGLFWTISLTFDPKKMKNSCLGLNALFQGSKVAKLPFYYILPKMMFGIVSEHFSNLRHIKRCNSCVSGRNALFRGIEVMMHPFYSSWPKMMFGSVSEHFANLWHIKRCKTCVSGLNALFWGTEVE
jgi:hypothetical protein